MRLFEHFNPDAGTVCPICSTNEDKETVLIPINETIENGTAEAVQVHSSCLEDNWHWNPGVIVCRAYYDYQTGDLIKTN